MMDFAHFAKQRYDAEAFEPNFEKADEQVFAASLESFRALTQSNTPMTNSLGQMFQLKAGYLEKMIPNAFAGFFDGGHYIGMHQALMVTIIDLCLFLFTQDDIFPHIGNADQELRPSFGQEDAPGLYLLKMTMAGETVEPNTDHIRVPQCADRHVAAVYMAILMSRYVWFHEMAHCTNGHVLLLQNQKYGAGVHEVELVELKKLRQNKKNIQSLRHAMEFDADQTALINIIRVQLEGRENIPGLLGYDDLTRMQMTILGVYLMTWLFEEYQRFANSRHGLSHPHPKLRLNNITSSARASIPELAPIAKQTRSIFNRLSNRLPGLTAIEDRSSALFDLEELNSQLEPFRFN